MARCLFTLLLALALLLPAAGTFAVEPDEILDDPALEARAREISAGLRCLVCQNQSIDDSNAPLAKDLRVLVRERLVAGDTDGEVVDFIVARYGEFVLLEPRVALHTLILWLGPPVLLFLAIVIVYRAFRRRQRESPSPPADGLTEAEQRKLDELLGEKG